MISTTRRSMLMTGGAALSFACSGRPMTAEKPSPEIANWRTGMPLPFAVQEIYPALHDGSIHLAGGFISDGETITGATDQHLAFDPKTETWESRVPLPRARHHPNLVSFKNALLSVGGFEVRSEEAIWVMQTGVWRLEDDAWVDAPALPGPNGESVRGVLGDQLHVCGGRQPVGVRNAAWTDHTDVAGHFVLADLHDTWETGAPLPTARNSAAAAVIGSNWHVVGGRTVADGNTPAHEVYDAKEDRWRTAAPMPQGQGGLAAAAVAGKLYAFGGEYFDNGGGVYPDAWSYDPSTDAWSALPDMPSPRHGLGAVAMDNDIYVIGGALEVGGSKTSNLVEIFTPPL